MSLHSDLGINVDMYRTAGQVLGERPVGPMEPFLPNKDVLDLHKDAQGFLADPHWPGDGLGLDTSRR